MRSYSPCELGEDSVVDEKGGGKVQRGNERDNGFGNHNQGLEGHYEEAQCIGGRTRTIAICFALIAALAALLNHKAMLWRLLR